MKKETIMREIKFRGLRSDGKGFAFGYYCNIQEKEHYILEPCALGLAWTDVIPETVGQFTGLKDKSGTETFVFLDLFEIGDDGGFTHDFGNGNTKLINDLESIAKYNSYHDINYLPYPVVKLMYEYHFDVHGLIESGHAIELKLN